MNRTMILDAELGLAEAQGGRIHVQDQGGAFDTIDTPVGGPQNPGDVILSIHPLHEVVDGFYLLVGGANLRTDLDIKVFQYLSETERAKQCI